MKKLISIIIPCYNQAVYLPKAITSLQAQTLKDWECIIVDDGSTDNSASIALEASNKDIRFRVIKKENGGSASARNLGLKEAKGEYIQFLDADDYMDCHKLQKQYEFMKSNHADITYTAFRHTDVDGNESSTLFKQLTRWSIFTRWGLGSSIPPHAFLYKTSFVLDNNIVFDERCRYREDWNWLIDCFKAHPKICTLPDYCGAYYFHNETGKTSSYIKMQSGNFIFMAHKCQYLSGINLLLWDFRISEELWIWLFRMTKYRSTEIASLIHLMHQNKHSVKSLIVAILMMPISFWWIIIYFVRTYIAK